MRRAVLPLLAVLTTVGLTACGGGGDDVPAAAPTTATPADTSAPPPAGPTAAPADLSDLLCVRDPSGTWRATGTLTNPTTSAIDYRVTVVVGSPGATALPARRAVLPRVAPRTPTTFAVDKIRVGQGAAPTCRVQVLRLPA